MSASNEQNVWDTFDDAIFNDNFGLVRVILEENGDLRTPYLETLLNIQSVEMMDLLLSLGCSLTLENDSLLAQYIRRDRVELVTHLLTKDGVDVNAFTEQGRTAFIEATKKLDIDTMARLLAKGADINRGVKEVVGIMGGVINSMEVGYTPLHFASCLTPELVQWLLERGANMNIENAMGRFPIHRAAFCNKLDILQLYLNRGVPVDIRGATNYTPLSDANGDKATIAFLLEHGADINGTFGPNRDTLLTRAVINDNVELISYLIRRGIDVYARRLDYPDWVGHGGRTALEIALQNRKYRAVQILVTLAPESTRPAFLNFMPEGLLTTNRIAVIAGANAANRRKPALLARASYQKKQTERYEAWKREQGVAAVGGGSAALPVALPVTGVAGAVPVPVAGNSTSAKANAALRKTRRKRRLSRKQRKTNQTNRFKKTTK